MAARRSNGEGGLSWNETRQRWIGRASLGYNADGKRRIGTVSARTKTEAKNKLRALLRVHEDGLPTQRAYTVGDAVEAWLVARARGARSEYGGKPDQLGPDSCHPRIGQAPACGADN